jgi:putative transposase
MPEGLRRYQDAGGFHFVTFSCYRREPLLAERDGYAVVERMLEEVRVRYEFVVAGYVLMPEHVHLLVSEPKRVSLAVALQVWKQESSRLLKLESEKQFWQRRYYDFNVRTEKKTVEKLKYMHRNPVVRGLVTRPEEWAWSSYRHYLSGERGTVEVESHWTAGRREGLCGR